MGFKGRSGHDTTGAPTDKQVVRWLRERSADRLLDQLVPKKVRKRDLYEDEHESAADEEPLPR